MIFPISFSLSLAHTCTFSKIHCWTHPAKQKNTEATAVKQNKKKAIPKVRKKVFHSFHNNILLTVLTVKVDNINNGIFNNPKM